MEACCVPSSVRQRASHMRRCVETSNPPPCYVVVLPVAAVLGGVDLGWCGSKVVWIQSGVDPAAGIKSLGSYDGGPDSGNQSG